MLAQHVAKSAGKAPAKPKLWAGGAQRSVHSAKPQKDLLQTCESADTVHGSLRAGEPPRANLTDIPVFSAGERDTKMPAALHVSHFPIQAKLNVGAVNDPLEHEADKVAASVMRRPSHGVPVAAGSPRISRKYIGRRDEHKSPGGMGVADSEPPESVDRVLRSPGEPLDSATRAFMEPRFGRDFSKVRVHDDDMAARSAKEIEARAYTAGNNLVFASGEFSPGSTAGRNLLAHELTHVVQQGGEARLIQRAPANYPSNDPVPKRSDQVNDPWADKPKPRLTDDDWIWMLETLRRESTQKFVKILAANEGFFYPILRPYGFKGSWLKNEDYVNDFDAAIVKWGKSYSYSLRFANIYRAVPQQKPKSREEQRYEHVTYLVRDMNRHGYLRSEVNSELEDNGLMDDLVSHGFEKHGDHSFKKGEEYKHEAIVALNDWLDRYDAAHGRRRQTSANVPTEPDEDVEYYRAWLEGLSYVSSSVFAAMAAGTASKFTSDPKKIAAAAGAGAAFEGVVFSFAGAFGGSYRPTVENQPANVAYPRYAGKQPIKPVADPAKVAAPPVREPIPPPDPVVKEPAKKAAKPNPPPAPPPPVKDPLPPASKTTGKTPDPGAGAAPKKKDPPTPPDEPAKAPGGRRKKNEPIDSKRQVEAKNRLAQTKAERSKASQEKAAADQKLESAKARVKKIEGELKPVPQTLRSKREAILKVKDLDERLDLVKEMRDSRRDWSKEEKEWLDQQVDLLDAQLDAIGSGVGKKKQGENVRDSTIQEPVREKELARASKSVAGLIRGEGPNYRANRDKVNYDQVMGETAWKALKAAQRKGAPALKLNTDHIISVREIRDEVVKSGLLEIHAKANSTVKEAIERAIQDLGDERTNLKRMEEVTNRDVKKDRSWWNIKYGEVEKYYTSDMVDGLRNDESNLREYYKTVIKNLVIKFSK